MKKIIVAGAGHGGLIAAAKLAKAGYNVIVVDKSNTKEIGHDAEDRFSFPILARLIESDIASFPEESWRYRGDCAFYSPAKSTYVVVNYDEEHKQKIMWRKPLLGMLVLYCMEQGVEFSWDTNIASAIIDGDRVIGIATDKGELFADLIIDACGVFSPVRMSLPGEFGIEDKPRRGDLFFSYRAYFDKTTDINPEIPFEVYMYHEGEQGLSWCCTNPDSVDILIGRIDPLEAEHIDELLGMFRHDHPYIGTNVLHGGKYSVIPVRRPLTLMVANGYAAVGDSAFMTMPMNGMGIDLSLQAGEILANSVLKAGDGELTREALWDYNKAFHKRLGAEAAKNEGLKNAILSMPAEGVEFLFENGIIQSQDLAGAGRNLNPIKLIGKFFRGMRSPSYFFALLRGISAGGKASKLYKNPPESFDFDAITAWRESIESWDVEIL